MGNGKVKQAKKVKAHKAVERGTLTLVHDGGASTREIAIVQDGATKERLQRIIDELSEFVQDGVVPFPLKNQSVVIDGRIQYAKRKKDGIDIMHENGTINDEELVVARVFQHVYELSNKDRIGSVDWISIRGGGMSVEAWNNRKSRATMKMREILRLAGDTTKAALAVYNIAGRGYSLRRMESEYGQNTHFWRGVFVCALQSISLYYLQGRRKPKV